MSDLLTCLAKASVFSKLSDADRKDLSNLALRQTYQKGEFICWQGESWPKAAYIASGRAEWSMLSPEGKRQVVFKMGACEVVWGHSLIDEQPMPASLEATEPTEIFLWPKETIMPVISRNVEAVWDVTHVLVTYMRHVREIVYGFAFHPVAGRLARLLLNHYQPVEGRAAPRDLTLDEMADSIGTTRELVSRTLHRFADEGMIEISRVQFIFKDRGQLDLLAGHDE